MRQLQRDQRSYWLGQQDAQSNRHRKLEIAIKRKQNHENNQHRKRSDKLHLVLRRKELSILPAPADPVPSRQRFLNVPDRLLPIEDTAFEIAPLDTVLHTDIP